MATTPATVSLLLPWPPKELSPNARHGHWSAGWKAKRDYKDNCWAVAFETKRTLDRPLQPPVRMDVAFLVKGRRSYDLDNLVARFKAGLDGVVRSRLLYDDSESYLKFGAVTIERGLHEPGVRVTFVEAEAWPPGSAAP